MLSSRVFSVFAPGILNERLDFHRVAITFSKRRLIMRLSCRDVLKGQSRLLRFTRIWVPDVKNRDLRQPLWHRQRMVQMRTRVMNQLHVVPMNEGLRRKKTWWRPTRAKWRFSKNACSCAQIVL